MADIILLSNPMTTQDDIIVGGASGAAGRLAKGSDGQVLTVDASTHHLVWATPSSGFANPMTTSGDIIYGASSGTPTRLAKGSDGQVLTLASGLPSWAAGGGGSISTVAQDIGADFTVSNDSSWHDVTGLTGMSLAAGTWIGMWDIEFDWAGNLGPVFRITDGATTYGQRGYITGAPPATVSNHLNLNTKPFVLASTGTLKCQVFSDTAFTIKRRPTRGGDTTVDATHVTFIKVA